MEFAGMLKRQDVLGLFDDTNFGLIPGLIAADHADFSLGNIHANRAHFGTLLDLHNCFGQGLVFTFTGAQKMKSNALSAFRSDTGQFVQFLNQSGYGTIF